MARAIESLPVVPKITEVEPSQEVLIIPPVLVELLHIYLSRLDFLNPGPADQAGRFFITTPVPIQSWVDQRTHLWQASFRYSPILLVINREQRRFEFNHLGEPLERRAPKVTQKIHSREVQGTGINSLAAKYDLKKRLIQDRQHVDSYSRGTQAQAPLIVGMRQDLDQMLVRVD